MVSENAKQSGFFYIDCPARFQINIIEDLSVYGHSFTAIGPVGCLIVIYKQNWVNTKNPVNTKTVTPSVAPCQDCDPWRGVLGGHTLLKYLYPFSCYAFPKIILVLSSICTKSKQKDRITLLIYFIFWNKISESLGQHIEQMQP